MKRTEILPMMAGVISRREFSTGKYYHIGWQAGNFVCVPAGLKKAPEIIFAKITSFSLETGLSSKEWDALEEKIYNFLEQKGL